MQDQGELTTNDKRSLSVSPNIKNTKSPPLYQREKLIGYYSLDSERKYHNDFRNLKYVKDNKHSIVDYDLNLMIDQRCAKKELDIIKELLDHMLRFLLYNKDRLNFPTINTLKEAKFCTSRGTLSNICKTPFEGNSEWKVAAQLYKSNIYFYQIQTKKQIEEFKNKTPEYIKLCAWGLKFEQFMSSETPISEPYLAKPNDENEEFNLVYESSLNGHKLIFDAEIDGIISDDEIERPNDELGIDHMITYLQSKTVVELKTYKNFMSNPRVMNTFRKYKSLSWWIQSYLGGVDKIICGFRDDKGKVKKLHSFSLDEIVGMRDKNAWDCNVCLNFLDSFLDFVKTCFKDEIERKHGPQGTQNIQELPKISLSFEWRSGEDVRVIDCDTDMLPDWFTNEYEKHKEDEKDQEEEPKEQWDRGIEDNRRDNSDRWQNNQGTSSSSRQKRQNPDKIKGDKIQKRQHPDKIKGDKIQKRQNLDKIKGDKIQKRQNTCKQHYKY